MALESLKLSFGMVWSDSEFTRVGEYLSAMKN